MFWLFSEIWFWCLLATALGTLLGWWLRGSKATAFDTSALDAEIARLKADLDACRKQHGDKDAEITRLKAELDACRAQHGDKDSELTKLRAAAAAVVAAPVVAAAVAPKFDTSALDGEIARLKADLEACRSQHAAKDAELAKLRAAAAAVDEKLPLFLDRPRGVPDDLKLIKGVGEKLNTLLTGLGIFHFRQVANWTADEVAQVDAKMDMFKGRIIRDEWIPQAKLLAAGKHEEFERIYGKMGENN
jgi:predicted flap endonuclease-1-like 5' DNA nuclease